MAQLGDHHRYDEVPAPRRNVEILAVEEHPGVGCSVAARLRAAPHDEIAGARNVAVELLSSCPSIVNGVSIRTARIVAPPLSPRDDRWAMGDGGPSTHRGAP